MTSTETTDARWRASCHPAKQRDGMRVPSPSKGGRYTIVSDPRGPAFLQRLRIAPAQKVNRSPWQETSLPLLSQLREQDPSNCAIQSLEGLAIACHYHVRPEMPREPTAKKQALAGLELMSFLIEHREWSHWRMIRDDR